MKHTKTIFAIFSIAMVIWLAVAPCLAVYHQDEVNLAFGNGERDTLYQASSLYSTWVYPYSQPFWSELDETFICATSWVNIPTPSMYSLFAESAHNTIDPETGKYDREAVSFTPFYGYNYSPPGVVGGDVNTLEVRTPVWELFGYERYDIEPTSYKMRSRISTFPKTMLAGVFTDLFAIEVGGGRVTIDYDLRIYTDDVDGTYVMSGSLTYTERGFTLSDVLDGSRVAFGTITITANSTPVSTASWALTDVYTAVETNGELNVMPLNRYLMDALDGGDSIYPITENGLFPVPSNYGYVNVNVPQYSGQPNLMGFVGSTLEGVFDMEFADGWSLGSVLAIGVVLCLMLWILKMFAGG